MLFTFFSQNLILAQFIYLTQSINGNVSKNIRLGGMGMKVFISVDMEGISGIVDSSQTDRNHKEYHKARALIPEMEVVAVKEAVSRRAAKCLHPRKARKRITETVTRALEKRDTINPFVFKPPVELEIRFTNSGMADAVAFMPSAERIDGKSVRFVLNDYIEAFGAFRASVYIAFAIDL